MAKKKSKHVFFTPELKARFLEHFEALNCCLQHAANATGISASTVYDHLESDPEFHDAFQALKKQFHEKLEQAAYTRAVEGIDDPIFQRGEHVGDRKVFSDGLLTLMLKRHIPEYRDKITADLNHTGSVLVVPSMAEDSHAWEKQHGGDSADEEDPGQG